MFFIFNDYTKCDKNKHNNKLIELQLKYLNIEYKLINSLDDIKNTEIDKFFILNYLN